MMTRGEVLQENWLNIMTGLMHETRDDVANYRDNDLGGTLLHAAVDRQDEDALKIADEMIKKGVDINVQDARGFTALHYASCPTMINFLIQSGAKVDCLSNNLATPLMLRIGDKHEDAALLLLKHDADPHLVPLNGSSPYRQAKMLKLTRFTQAVQPEPISQVLPEIVPSERSYSW